MVDLNIIMTEGMLDMYLKRLRTGCAAGVDCIQLKHITSANNASLTSTLCSMLTLCIRFGIVAESFTKGLLLPLLKKPNLDPSAPKNYRPIVISNTFSKLLEVHILDACDEHEFHDLQFGFISSRGTSMAGALTHDVIDYCINNDSPVYACALDAEAAFDGIPHDIMFDKALGIIPTIYCRLLMHWYRRLTVVIKWYDRISDPILVQRGTRQGGLSSPFLFNLLYQDMVNELSEMPYGVTIEGTILNLCCYADDILLCSLSVSGLQRLIDGADSIIHKTKWS